MGDICVSSIGSAVVDSFIAASSAMLSEFDVDGGCNIADLRDLQWCTATHSAVEDFRNQYPGEDRRVLIVRKGDDILEYGFATETRREHGGLIALRDHNYSNMPTGSVAYIVTASAEAYGDRAASLIDACLANQRTMDRWDDDCVVRDSLLDLIDACLVSAITEIDGVYHVWSADSLRITEDIDRIDVGIDIVNSGDGDIPDDERFVPLTDEEAIRDRA